MMSKYENLKKWRKENPEKARELIKNYKRNHPEETKRDKEKYYNKNNGNDTNKRQRYTAKEISLILNKDFSDTELAKMLKRSMQAIQIARCRYKTV